MWEMYENQESAMNRSMNAGVYGIGTNVIIGASLCEPHTSELNGGFFIFIYIYISAVRTSFRKMQIDTLLTRKMCTPIRAGEISKTIT